MKLKCLLCCAAWMILPTLGWAHPHTVPEGSASAPSGDVLESGKTSFRYVYEPDRLPLPDGVEILHAHGLCRDREGRIYLAYETAKPTDATHAILRFSPDGRKAEVLDTVPALAAGSPHGLAIHYEGDGQGRLYQANNGRTVHKLQLDGTVIWSQQWAGNLGRYKPTDTTVTPDGKTVYVADGYGDSMIHALRTSDGVYAGHSFGGRGKAHGRFNTPHGITWDPRHDMFCISDRGNARLEYYTGQGLYHHSVTAPEITQPCNVDVWGDHLLVPNLDGTVAILDRDNKPAAVIELARLLGKQGHQHPHDAIFLENGDVVIGTWNPGRVSYWRKLPAN